MQPDFQAGFAAALRDPFADPPAGFSGRYNVHRNNVLVSLVDALAAGYPSVQGVLGDSLFRTMARDHVRESPPATPLLFEYGRGFPDFLDRKPYAHGHFWLADVARIERAWLDAFHARDVEPLSANSLAAVSAALLGSLKFVAHPAASIVRSRYASTSLFVAIRSEESIAPIDPRVPENALITRPKLAVEVRHLPAGGCAFMESLMAGSTLAAAASEAFKQEGCFDLAAGIASMIEAGVFTGIAFGSKDS